MNIEKYISELLYRYQCVVVPNFGAFVSEVSSSKYNEVSRSFSPPKKNIMFNSLIKNNDGLLANHIARSKNIDFEEAMKMIDNSVELWKNELKNIGTIHLQDIGTIGNKNGNMYFESIGSTNYLTTSFGLSTVVSPAYIKTEKTKVATAKKVRFGWVKYAAAILVGVLSYIGYDIYNVYEFDKMMVDKNHQVEKRIQAEITAEIQKATFFIETPPIEKKEEDKKEFKIPEKYHLVAGAFRTEKKCAKMVEMLKAEGYTKAKYLEKSKHNMRNVVYDSYTTHQEAQEALKEMHKKGNVKAWIYIED